MGHHGWQGDPPRTQALARERIIDAANRCIDRSGVAKTTLSDVAVEVGVTRQTVYRYFASLDDLLSAVAQSGATTFIEQMRSHLVDLDAPVDVVIEAIVFCLEELPREPRIGLLLDADEDLFGRGITSTLGVDLAVQFLRSLPVDWTRAGVGDQNGLVELDGSAGFAGLRGLAELMLRLIGSLTQHPTEEPRSPDDVRAYLRRWLGPALAD